MNTGTFWVVCAADPSPTPTPTSRATPTPTPSQSVGGVLGTTTTTPATGAAIPVAPAAALIAFGGVLTLIARRRGREDH